MATSMADPVALRPLTRHTRPTGTPPICRECGRIVHAGGVHEDGHAIADRCRPCSGTYRNGPVTSIQTYAGVGPDARYASAVRLNPQGA